LSAGCAKKPKDVAIGTKRGKGWITLSPLPKQPEPKHLPRLKTEILRSFGVIGLLDIFKEAAMLTGCLDCFESTGSREAIVPDLLHKRLLLCLYGLGTNMGLKRMAGVDPHITASKKFHAVDQNLLTQWHARYHGPGVLVRLPCGTPLGLHLFAVKVLYLLGGGRHARRGAAPLYRDDDQASHDRFARP
jgi:hypothetical protein